MAEEPTVRIDGLTVRYGSMTAVDRMSLSLAAGEIFGLVGPNGAGKTTALKVLAGLLLPDEGTATVCGLDVVSQRDTVRRHIGYMADFFGVYDYLTAHEYLSFFGAMYGLESERLDRRIKEVLQIVNLTQKEHAPVRTLSRGMKQRLYFARAVVHEPQLLILDEPASGMDPRGRAEMVESLKAINSRGATIIISSHILDELQNLCTSVGVMEASRLVAVRPLRGGQDGESRRRVLLQVIPADVAAALSALQTDPDVFAVKAGDAGLIVETRDDDFAVAALVGRLVRAGVRILLPRTDTSQLRDVFLKMTRGELM